MGNKVSIVDFVHAIFKNNVIDICKKGDEYLLGTRLTEAVQYDDGREILFTFSVQGLGTTAQILERFGLPVPPGRPYFAQGDKELIAKALLDGIKQKRPDWPDFLDDKITFEKGGRGYSS